MTHFRSITRVLMVTGLLAAATFGLSACNTTRGIGEDASSVGHNTSRAATGAQNAIAGSTGASTH